MIKKLSLKFVLVFLVLVVSGFITSSCYATTLTEADIEIVSLSDFGITMDDVYSYIQRYNTTDYNFPDDFSHGVFADYVSSKNIRFMFFAPDYNFDYVVYESNGVSRKVVGYDSSYTLVNSVCFATCTYDTTTSTFSDCSVGSIGSHVAKSAYSGATGVLKIVDCTTYDIHVNSPTGDIVYTADVQQSVDVTHEFQSDTSAKINFSINNAPEGAYLQYSLTGVEINTDLTAPLQLRNPITYTPRSNEFSC